MRRLSFFLLLFGIVSVQFSYMFAAENFQIGGDLGFRAKYTPESKMLVEKNLNFSSKIVLGKDIVGTVEFMGLGDGKTWVPVFDSNGRIDFQLWRVSVGVRAPLYPGGLPVLTTFGDVPLDYSPYLFTANNSMKYYGEWINPSKAGLSINDFQFSQKSLFGNLALDGCVLLDQGISSAFISDIYPQEIAKKGVLYAARTRLHNKLAQATLVTANFVGEKPSDANDYFLLKDNAFLLQIQSEQKLSYDFMYGINIREYKQATSEVSYALKGNLCLAEVAYNLTPLTVRIGYQYVDPKFDPEYRDRTPRYDEYGETLAWNPLDSLNTNPAIGYFTSQQKPITPMGRQGGYFGVETNLGQFKLEGLLNSFNALQTEVGVTKASYDVLTCKAQYLLNSLRFNTYLERVQENLYLASLLNDYSTSQRARFEITKVLKEDDNYTLSVVGRYDKVSLSESPLKIDSKDAFVEMIVHSGKYKGFRGQIGLSHETRHEIEAASTLLFKTRLKYYFSPAFQVGLHLTTPQITNEALYNYFDEYVGENNLFQIEVHTTF